MINFSGISPKEMFHVSLAFQWPSMNNNYAELPPYNKSK